MYHDRASDFIGNLQRLPERLNTHAARKLAALTDFQPSSWSE
jgi:hypothetical protein